MTANRRPSRRELEIQCKRFNESIAVGDEVFVKLDGKDEPFRTRTRSDAQVLGDHSAVVWLENVRGCYAISRVVRAAGV
jgi:hypothetical protein